MKKINLKAAISCLVCAIFAVALIFTACKKEEDKAPAAPKKSMAVNCINEGFDPEASYTTRGNGADGWNQVQDFIPGGHHTTYNFWLENTAGETFISFCGGFSSSDLGLVAQNLTLEFDEYADIVGVLNYINNLYGSIDAWSGYQGTITNTDPAANTKLIAQYAIWSILGQIVTSNVPAIDNAVLNVIANGKSATGDIDIYFLVGANFPTDIDGIQPQIVPFCVEVGFENAAISFTKMKLVGGEEVNAEPGEFVFDLFKKVGTQYSQKIDTYETDFLGMVSARGLEVGEYVFIEQKKGNWKVAYPTTGLYFTIEQNNPSAVWAEEYFDGIAVNVETLIMSGLNWNNGTTSNGNGANGAGLIQFTVDGFTYKNNKNYVTPANFEAALASSNPSNTDIYTVTERHTSQLGDKKADKYTDPITGKYTKIYYVQVGRYRNGAWQEYAGTITVDNPGGNNDKQKVEIYRVL